jgi:hypothetical protein
MGGDQESIGGKACSQELLGAQEVWAEGNHRASRVQSMYGGVPPISLVSAAGNNREISGLKGWPSVNVGQGGRSQCTTDVVHVTRFFAPGHEAPFSLPQSIAFAVGTIADALQLHADAYSCVC